MKTNEEYRKAEFLTDKEVKQYIQHAKIYFAGLRISLDQMEADLCSDEKEKKLKAIIFSSCMMLCLKDIDNKLEATLVEAKNFMEPNDTIN